jgi:ferredoxin
MKAVIDKELCVGCGLCVATCADVYEMDGALAIVKVDVVPAAKEPCAKQAADECPVTAITTSV